MSSIQLSQTDWFTNFLSQKDKYSTSQYGQSEWIFEFLKLCEIREGTVFEAGAGSPHQISNSRIFRENGYKALLCEASTEIYEEWSAIDKSNTTIINKRIDYNRKGLENLLIEMDSPYSLEVLFLDIDGGEYHLIEGLDLFRPKLICIEYDNSYPLNIDYIPSRIRHGFQQASSIAMFKMMRSKGYKYLNSFSQDHVFIAEEFLDNHVHLINATNVKFGDQFYFDYAPRHIYRIDSVCANQDEKNGESGVLFYESKLNNLIASDYMDDAKNFYCFLCDSFKAVTPMVRTRGDSYFSKYINAYENFRASFLWLIKC